MKERQPRRRVPAARRRRGVVWRVGSHPPESGWPRVTMTLWRGETGSLPSICLAWRGDQIYVQTMPAASDVSDIWSAVPSRRSLPPGPQVGGAVERLLAMRDTVLEQCDDRVAALEAQIAAGASDQVKAVALGLRHQLLTGRRIVAAERRSMYHLLSDAETAQGDRAWLAAAYDHLVGQQTRLDMLRDLINGVLDAHFASVSARLNEIVKTLTVVTTLLLPASLVAALYGMNFQHLPGADSPYGFWMVLGVVAVIAGTLLTLFRRRHWL